MLPFSGDKSLRPSLHERWRPGGSWGINGSIKTRDDKTQVIDGECSAGACFLRETPLVNFWTGGTKLKACMVLHGCSPDRQWFGKWIINLHKAHGWGVMVEHASGPSLIGLCNVYANRLLGRSSPMWPVRSRSTPRKVGAKALHQRNFAAEWWFTWFISNTHNKRMTKGWTVDGSLARL